MAEALDFILDDDSAEQVRRLWARLASAGLSVPDTAPSVRFASAVAIPQKVRGQLADDLRLLVLPEVWLATLGTILTAEPALVLGAVVDAELVATHAVVHDALAGRVREPSSRHLPGSWVPHCVLSREIAARRLGPALNALGNVEAIRARVVSIGITDTRTGEVAPLRGP